jgi:hypothetical protein
MCQEIYYQDSNDELSRLEEIEFVEEVEDTKVEDTKVEDTKDQNTTSDPNI